MKITKENEEIVIRVPFWSKRINPYMEEKDTGEHTTLIGLLTLDEWGNDNFGFAYVIDMDYKGKEDQWTDIAIHYWDIKAEDFIKLCTDLGIGYIDSRLADKNTNYEED